MSRAAVVKIGYIDGVVRSMSIVEFFDEDDGIQKAHDYIRQNLIIPKDVANRTELIICDVDENILLTTRSMSTSTSTSQVRMKAVKVPIAKDKIG